MRLRVFVQTKESVKGFVLPREAVVRASNGEQVVWILVSPERFEAKPVLVEAIDGGSVAVTAGLSADQRVVVHGATLINQIR